MFNDHIVYIDDDGLPLDRSRPNLKDLELGGHSREYLEDLFPQVWSPTQLRADFSVLAFDWTWSAMAMEVIYHVKVRRKLDNATGQLSYQTDPRYYFDFCLTNPK